jgi:uncharacterized protein YodC (DUF2158 family)
MVVMDNPNLKSLFDPGIVGETQSFQYVDEKSGGPTVFAAGEVVRLKSGGPLMTVTGMVAASQHLGGPKVAVVWYSFDMSEVQIYQFPKECLIKEKQDETKRSE